METHTKGPWRVNERLLAIVSDEPCTDILGAENVEHYGGYLIAESIAPRNLSIIAAAPDLLSDLRAAACYIDALGGDSSTYRKTIAKAEGK